MDDGVGVGDVVMVKKLIKTSLRELHKKIEIFYVKSTFIRNFLHVGR